jgi:hypothetical protein
MPSSDRLSLLGRTRYEGSCTLHRFAPAQRCCVLLPRADKPTESSVQTGFARRCRLEAGCHECLRANTTRAGGGSYGTCPTLFSHAGRALEQHFSTSKPSQVAVERRGIAGLDPGTLSESNVLSHCDTPTDATRS